MLAARLAVLPPTRRAGRADHIVTGRVLLRYCDCTGLIRRPYCVVPAGGSDPGVAVIEAAVEPGHLSGAIVWPASVSAAPQTPGFLIRPPSHLLC